MAITTKQFQLLSDINLVWDFLVETYDWKNADLVWSIREPANIRVNRLRLRNMCMEMIK